MSNLTQNKGRKFGIGDFIVICLVALIIVGIISLALRSTTKVNTITYNDLVEMFFEKDANGVDQLKSNISVETITIEGIDNGANHQLAKVSGTYKKTSKEYTENKYKQFTGVMDYTDAHDKIKEASDALLRVQAPADEQKFESSVRLVSSFNWLALLEIAVPIVLVVLLFIFMIKSSSAGNNQAFDFGKNRAKLTRKSGTTFKDVAGLTEEKEEMVEVVDFLRNPKKYYDMGARIPKGIILVGPPGTGKTLLARAVAGEANVPFYTISGSDFVEMFVGVGASRVRDMFKVAKQNAPCIIFIDEIDAVGRQRGTGLGGGHDEREQTLNQLLVEMDGFGGNSGIIVMAATNRVDILDPALLRPGRFDRQIHISNPDVSAREEILKVHARNKRFSARVNLGDIAKRTPGFSGADLENLLNEAALLAARENCHEIKIYHLDEAIDRVMMGPAKKSRKYSEEEKRIVSYHEAGHAVIGLKLPHANVVQKVTIVPRGDAGGYNLMTPEKETFLQTKQQLTAEITGFLGGRIAEELVFNEVTTGAHNDFQNATVLARAMVTEYGMSALGPVQYERNNGSVFLGRDYMADKNFSDQVALEIDREERRIIDDCYQKGVDIIRENRALLDLIAQHLMEIETLTKEDIDELVNTGKLAWYEKKKAKLAQQAEAKLLEEAKRQQELQNQQANASTPDSNDATVSSESKPEEKTVDTTNQEEPKTEEKDQNETR
jgi:cell division protease FtsH